jgi:hypothetical protein
MRKTEVRRKITRAEGKKDEKLMGIRWTTHSHMRSITSTSWICASFTEGLVDSSDLWFASSVGKIAGGEREARREMWATERWASEIFLSALQWQVGHNGTRQSPDARRWMVRGRWMQSAVPINQKTAIWKEVIT